MSTQFQYSLLQYHHLKREEWLTIGVLVLFAQIKQVHFLYPEKIARLRCAFPDAPEKLIRSWLSGFCWQTENLNAKPDIFAHYDLDNQVDKLVDDYFLPIDNSALQFGKFKSSVLYNEDPLVICEHLRVKFLSIYQQEEEYGAKDNHWLIAQYRKFLRDKNPEILSKKILRENFSVDFRQREYKFDFAWQNHTFNLVKAVSLDLKRPDSIQRKAEQFYGQFSLLQKYADDKNARFDVLLARPANKKLYPAYDKAIEDITQAENVNIIQPEAIKEYAERTIAEIVFPNEVE